MPVEPEASIATAYNQGIAAAQVGTARTANPYAEDGTASARIIRAAWFLGYDGGAEDAAAVNEQTQPGRVLLPNGSSSLPSLAFISEPALGLLRFTAGRIRIRATRLDVVSILGGLDLFDINYNGGNTYVALGGLASQSNNGVIFWSATAGVSCGWIQGNFAGTFSLQDLYGQHTATRIVTTTALPSGVRKSIDVGNFEFARAGNIVGLIGGGAAVASAAALPAPTGRVFHVTGTTGITSITSTGIASGTVITLIFDAVLTVTDGGNLRLNGDFVTSADDTLTLVYDGTNWFELGRSTN